MTKVYFACYIRGGRDDQATYLELVRAIKNIPDVELLTEIFANGALTAMGSSGTSQEIHAQDLAWVREADVIIAEVSHPSLGVGYEIAKAEGWGIPVLALYRPREGKRLSAMIDGSPHVQVVQYHDLAEANNSIVAFMQGLNAGQ